MTFSISKHGTQIIGLGEIHRAKCVIHDARYTREGAKKDFGVILRAHNNGTSWSSIKQNS